jgi:hypothetical protein
MNRKIVLLNLALIALLAMIGWRLRARWQDARAHERMVLAQAAKPKEVIPPALPQPVQPAAPAAYIEVAQKTLFSKDRNPTVIIEVPPPAKPDPEPPLPDPPAYFGQMAIGEPVVFLGFQNVQKSYRAGDDVGPFKLIAFDQETITLEWRGKQIERKLAELAPKQTPAAQPASVPALVAKPAAGPVSLAGGSAPASAAKQNPAFGNDMGGGFRACAPGDTSPPGTVIEGFRKLVAQTAMGPSCHWEQVK